MSPPRSSTPDGSVPLREQRALGSGSRHISPTSPPTLPARVDRRPAHLWEDDWGSYTSTSPQGLRSGAGCRSWATTAIRHELTRLIAEGATDLESPARSSSKGEPDRASLTETLRIASPSPSAAGYTTAMLSHRSGETEEHHPSRTLRPSLRMPDRSKTGAPPAAKACRQSTTSCCASRGTLRKRPPCTPGAARSYLQGIIRAKAPKTHDQGQPHPAPFAARKSRPQHGSTQHDAGATRGGAVGTVACGVACRILRSHGTRAPS
jgi:hypothetical protein